MKIFKKLISLLLVIVMVAVCIPFAAFAEDTALPTSELQNLYLLLNDESETDLKIAYLGGSVTDGSGASDLNKTSWRALVGQWFVDSFGPESPYGKNVTNVHAAIGATGSYFGAYRVWQDAQFGSDNPPDVLFVEFGINDIYDVISQDEVAAYYESIIRQAYKANPKMNVIPVFTMDLTLAVNFIKNGDEGSPYFTTQRKIAEYYGLPQINVGRALINVIDAEYKAAGSALTTGDNKEGTIWRKYIKDTCHPQDAGYKIYADTVTNYIAKQLGDTVDHTAPVDVRNLDTLTSYAATQGKAASLIENGRYISFKDAGFTQADVRGWILSTKDAASNLAISNGTITTNSQNASFALKFKGTSVAFFNRGYPESGTLQYTITSLTDPTKVYTGSKSLVKNYTTGLPIPAQIASGLPEDEYVAEFILVPGEKGVRGELYYIYIDGDIDSVEPAKAPKTNLPPIVANPLKTGNWGPSGTATTTSTTHEGLSSILVKSIAGKTAQYECWNTRPLSIALPENKYVGITYYYDPGMETSFVPQTTVRLDRAGSEWVNTGDNSPTCVNSAPAIAGKWVTQYYDFSSFAETYADKKVVGSVNVLPFGSQANIPAEIKAEYIEKARFWFANAMFSSEMPYIYNEAGEALTVNDGSAIAYVSESGKITVGGKELKAYKTIPEAINILAPVGGTVKFSGAMAFSDGTLYPKHLNVTIEGLDSSALITNTNIALLGGDIEFKNLTITGHNDEYWTYTAGHILTLGENLTMTNVLRPAATPNSAGKPNLVNIYSGSYGNFAAMAGYANTFTVTGDTIYNIYGGKFNGRIDGVTRDGKGSGKQVHKGDVIYNIYGGSLLSLNTTTTEGTLEGNLIYNINGGKFASGHGFSFGPSQNAYTVNVSGSQAYIINNKEIKENGGSVAGVHIGTKIQNGLTTGNKIVIINNNELSVDTGAAISTNTVADYNILVNNGAFEPSFDENNVFIGFKAIPDEQGSIPYLGTVAMKPDANGLYQLEKRVGEIQMVSFRAADSIDVIYKNGDETAGSAGKQNGTIVVGNNTFVKQGYTFNGWETANGNVYYPGATYTLGTEAVTFTARWVKTSDITTVYVKSGAVGSGVAPEFPAPDFKIAQALIGDNTRNFTIVVDGEMKMTGYTHYFNSHSGTITITGTESGVLSWDSQFYLDGPAIIKNIKLRVLASNNFVEANGKPITFGEGVTVLPTTDGGSTTYLPQIHAGLIGNKTPFQYLEFQSGNFNNVYVGAYYNDTGAADDISEGARVVVGGNAVIENLIFRPDGYNGKQGKTEWTNAPSVIVTGGTVKNISTRLYSDTYGAKYNYPLQVVVNNGLDTPNISDSGKAGVIIVKTSSEGNIDVTLTPGVFKITTKKDKIYIDGVLTEKTADNCYTINTPGTHVVAYDMVQATFASDDGEGVAPTAAAVFAGTKITLPENTFTREGFTFAGWYDGNALYAAGAQYAVEKNVTIKAMWKNSSASVIYLSSDGVVDTNFDGFADAVAQKTIVEALAAVPAAGGTIYAEGDIELPATSIDTNANRGAVTIRGIGDAASAKLIESLNYTGYVFRYGDATIDNITIKPVADEIWFGAQNGCTLTMGAGIVTETNGGFNIHMGLYSCASDGNIVINGGKYSKLMSAGTYTGNKITHTGTVRYTFNGGTFSELYGGSRNGYGATHTSTGDRYYTFNGGTFNNNIYTGSHKGDTINGNVVFTVNGGKYNGKSIIAGHSVESTNVAAVNAAIIVNNASFGEDDNISGTVIGREGAGRGTITNEILIINNKEIATGVSIHANSTAGYKIHAYYGKAIPAFENKVGGALLGFELIPDVEGAVPCVNGTILKKNTNGYYTLPENKEALAITSVEFIDEYAVIGGVYTSVVNGTVTALNDGEINLDHVTKPEKANAVFLGFKNERTDEYVTNGSMVAKGDVIAPEFAEFVFDEKEEGFNFGTIGAQVRLKGDPALRFVASVSEELLAKIGELNENLKPDSYEETGIGFGYVVLPVSLLDGELTKQTAKAGIIPAVKLFEKTEEKTLFTVCLTGLTSDKYTRDYAVVPYITFKDNYGTEHTVYGEQYFTNMVAVASTALDDPDREYTEDEITALKLISGR